MKEKSHKLIGKRCYSVNGFNFHANTAINTHSSDKLVKLIEYLARGWQLLAKNLGKSIQSGTYDDPIRSKKRELLCFYRLVKLH
jgi:hypothetical protein